MTLEQINALGEEAKDDIEKAIKKAWKIRAALCRQAESDSEYGSSVVGMNNVLQGLLQAHSDGIAALTSAPTDVIRPMFGGK